MKVDLGTIELNDRQRRAIRHYYGKTGLATRAEVRTFLACRDIGNRLLRWLMAAGKVIESGSVNGIPYRVWQRHSDSKKIVYAGVDVREHGKTGRRRNMKWLKKQKMLEVSE